MFSMGSRMSNRSAANTSTHTHAGIQQTQINVGVRLMLTVLSDAITYLKAGNENQDKTVKLKQLLSKSSNQV